MIFVSFQRHPLYILNVEVLKIDESLTVYRVMYTLFKSYQADPEFFLNNYMSRKTVFSKSK